jgi:iron complex transport system substrate-binding protein
MTPISIRTDPNLTAPFRTIILVLIVFIGIMHACISPGNRERPPQVQLTQQAYARGFRIDRFNGFTLLHVVDPWQGSSGVHYRYVLAEDPGKIPDSLDFLPSVRIPVNRVICMSTTHLAMIEALGRTGSVVGISGTDYVSNPQLRKKLESGEVKDVGADQTLDIERIISLSPDVLISYGITSEVSNLVQRLGGLGIPVVLNGDYLEREPLGKTEWLKFMAAFFGMDREADSIFSRVVGSYEFYREKASEAATRPNVMTGLPWKDAWYIPGGESFAAAFIRDAGGHYLWEDMKSHEASPVSLESVFARGMKADIWINSGAARSLREIRQADPRLARLKPFQNGMVFNNTARLNAWGGNDFWETGVMEPNRILADLVRIFHPDMLPEYELWYYEKLH